MRGPFREYWFECANCGYLASNFVPVIGHLPAHDRIDEDARLNALRQLRKANFDRILDVLSNLTSSELLSLLEVGYGDGWFLLAAADRGYKTLGLEPDPVIARNAKDKGLDVIEGYFPDALPRQAQFDLIVFNDVFEHLPDPQSAVQACFTSLRPGGMLVLNLPNSKGIFFHIARVLSFLGFSAPLDRMWQRGFPSPHISYFHPQALASLLIRFGFTEIYRGNLSSLSQKGLWGRLTFYRGLSRLYSVFLFPIFYLLAPLLKLFPADISLQVFRKES